ncbi:hypothetical protein OSB04_013920 [Centaurea solstitialis]|uniref:Disease resistance protein n=1 Tax=Centaurea solstitialis TaxID=347529 RepID=A0AA38TS25_9ASTR|nr:hypothetical protein OSB04_013920 [Centaurea solstitialis]
MGKICPSWMMKLRNLVKIKFWWCDRCESIPPLGKLPCLKVIDLHFMAISCLDDDEFPSLQELTMQHCHLLVSLPSNLPTLEELTLVDLPGLVSLPNNLPKLTRLNIGYCPELHCLPNGLKELTFLRIGNSEELQRRCKKEKGIQASNEFKKQNKFGLLKKQKSNKCVAWVDETNEFKVKIITKEEIFINKRECKLRHSYVMQVDLQNKMRDECSKAISRGAERNIQLAKRWQEYLSPNINSDVYLKRSHGYYSRRAKERIMADGLISGLVSDVLKTLASTAFQEFTRLRRLEVDVSALRDTYESIQAVLADAEVKQREQEAVKVWLNRLRSASLELENILDDVVADAMLRKLRHELDWRIKYKVRAFFPSNRIPLLDRIRVANKVKAIRRKLEVIDAEKSRYQLTSNAGFVVNDTTNMEETTSLVPVFEIYGRDEEVMTVVENICSKDTIGDDIEGVRVYAVWGMGGMGKTTLAQLIYNHERVKAHFELRAWVYVSNDFQVKKLTREISESIDKTPCELSQLDAMQVALQNKLEGKRFLIVLDDVWIEERTKWDELSKALNSGAEGSIVMVTTRNETTSRMIAKVPEFQHRLGCLSEDESWSLFKKLAFAPGSKSEGENIMELESIGKEIVKKCKGLPLAVKTLGGLMWSKNSVSSWQRVKDNDAWEELQEDGILPALKLSYDNLLPNVKLCFAYSCLFPKGYEMRKNLLIELWMANGFIPSRGQANFYEVGDEIFYCLVSRSFLQDVQEYGHDDLVCKMHDLMHDLGRYLMRCDYFFIEACKDLISPDDAEVLHFSSSCPNVSFADQDLKRLRSLRSLFIVVGEYESNMFSQLSKHVYLRVLYLDGINVSPLPESICKLKHLRFLSVCRSRIESLPESIICLQNLQVLLVKHCRNLLKLPEGMRYMKNLRCLDNEECDRLDCMPVGIKELGCLTRLGLFVVGEKKGSQITELGDLNLLGGRLELRGLENVGGLEEAKSANLKHKTNLMSLVLHWRCFRGSEENVDDEDVVEGLEPNSSLKELDIRDYMGKMICPSWMTKLRNLVKIEFWWCLRCERIPPLGKLPSVKIISLAIMAIRCLDDDEFPSLQELTIQHCPQLVSLPNNLPKLTGLHIKRCPKLRFLPNGLKELSSLEIRDCEELERRCEKEKGEDWPKISHVPNLILGDNW